MPAEKYDEEIESLGKSIQDFTIDLYKEIARDSKGNIVMSALSAHLVLAMAASGAGKDTAKQILKTLHLKNSKSDRKKLKKIVQKFMNIFMSLTEFKLANKIYASNLIRVKDDFKELTKEFYFSECETIDFDKSEEACEIINQWCSDKTDNKINNFFTPDSISREMTFMLLNAVTFSSEWEEPFSRGNIRMEPFYPNGYDNSIEVMTMTNNNHFYITREGEKLEGLDASCCIYPYKNEDFYMAFVLPSASSTLDVVEKNMDKVYELILQCKKSGKREGIIVIPKFKIKSSMVLDSHLQNLGLQELFKGKPDFSGICSAPTDCIKVDQQAFIEVNEKGTEAGATTRFRGFWMTVIPELRANRPFLYMIFYKNITLFSGRVMNPLEE